MPTSSIWKFTRAPWAVHNRHRVSTDAVGALSVWCDNTPDRDFKELTDADAEPAFFRIDAAANDHTAAADLDKLCAKHGVERVRAQPNELPSDSLNG